MTVRIVLGMIMGMSSYSWLLRPDTGTMAEADQIMAGMVKLALWGVTSDGDATQQPN
jgi:hypothetical protein